MPSSTCHCQAAQAARLYLPASKLSQESSLCMALLLSLCVSLHSSFAGALLLPLPHHLKA